MSCQMLANQRLDAGVPLARGRQFANHVENCYTIAMRNRLYQILLIGTFLPLCWLPTKAVHELGHVACCLATGSAIPKVVLNPLTFSRTDSSGQCIRPCSSYGRARLSVSACPCCSWRSPRSPLRNGRAFSKFFAVLVWSPTVDTVGAGSLGRVGDAGDMIRL